ncbi:MAG: PaaI family thioesterase [Thermonemataceae bacterium]
MDKSLASLKRIYERQEKTMTDFLGIEFTEVGEDYICAKMPVDERTVQPAGILHGGASVVLAETLGSVASNFMVDQEKYMCVGLEINANHLRPILKGNWVFGKATAIHIGKKTHVWDIQLSNEQGKLTCVSRLTIAVIEKK